MSATTTEIMEDLSALTTIPKVSIYELFHKSELIMEHKLAECLQRGENVAQIDIGIGTLFIGVESDEVKYKFVPAVVFNNGIKKVVTTKESPLVEAVETRLRDRILNTYKDLL